MRFYLVVFTLVVGTVSAVVVDVDCSKAEDLCKYGTKIKNELEKWYPLLAHKMTSPTFKEIDQIQLTFDPNYEGIAYVCGNRIIGSVKYYRNNRNDFGSMIHELVHVIQGYKKHKPRWLTEGIADYWRYYHYQPSHKLRKPGPHNSYTQGYGIAACLINYINIEYPFKGDQNILYYLNKDLREETYNDNIFPKLLNKTVDELWSDMLSTSYECPVNS